MVVNARRLIRVLPSLAAAAVAGLMAYVALNPSSQAARDDTGAFPGGEAGFVVTEFSYVLPEGETAGAFLERADNELHEAKVAEHQRFEQSLQLESA